MKARVAAAAAIAALAIGTVAGCSTDAEVASKNLSKAADQFEIDRRIVFFNGITDKYLLTIEGRCSIEPDGGKLDVTCKTAGGFKKHFLGLSDNVSYFVEQLEGASVSTDHYRVIFKPEVIVPIVSRP
ncbi:beta-sandwich lipoprotein [Rhodococcus qingshengii]|uniref:beta-sandwich lipoprotein n=1 Tax=Rhodococcus qingshengii TaxID=334542 RepID=UPI001C8C5993|nr:hypothetical protein [Rhodococcus qingshengii]MBX9150067.1 hypothetical protein [Rhodococcus qingshengii]